MGSFESEKNKARIRRWLWTVEAYVEFLYYTFLSLWSVVFMNFARSISTPITTGLWLFSFFVIQLMGLFLVTVIGLIYAFNMNKVLDFICKTWGDGFSLVNMDNPQMFEKNKATVAKASNAFEAAFDRPDPIPTDGHRIRFFDMNVAKTLLLMSSAMYERDEDAIADLILEMEAVKQQQDWTVEKCKQESDRIKEEEIAAEQKIHDIATQWDLKFEGLSNLNTYGGAFCGLWYKEGSNWIVVAFKGTTPLSGVEWLTNLTYVKTNANAFLSGSAHQGWYSRLFPDPETDVSFSPYGKIVERVNELAEQLSEHDQPVNVYVTGHSLGSAIASMFYARARKSPREFSADVRICNAYVYGTPNTGDVDYLAGYYSFHNVPFFDTNMLYRIVNRYDIVCRFPVGVAENRMRRDYLDEQDAFNFGHIGDQIYINGKPYASFVGNNFAPPVQVRVKNEEHGTGSVESIPQTINRDRKDVPFALDDFTFFFVLFALLPSFVTDGAPVVFISDFTRFLFFLFVYLVDLAKYYFAKIFSNKGNDTPPPKPPAGLNPIPMIFGIAPNFLADHAPSHYLEHLENLKPKAPPTYESARSEHEAINHFIAEASSHLFRH